MITKEEYYKMFDKFNAGEITEMTLREFCDKFFAQTLEENKDVFIRMRKADQV